MDLKVGNGERFLLSGSLGSDTTMIASIEKISEMALIQIGILNSKKE
tara:strand:+ start:55468 stop:55608 length:141 start_codon:yes stop_codon:yes gene_type:complete